MFSKFDEHDQRARRRTAQSMAVGVMRTPLSAVCKRCRKRSASLFLYDWGSDNLARLSSRPSHMGQDTWARMRQVRSRIDAGEILPPNPGLSKRRSSRAPLPSDLERLEDIARRPIPHWVPDTPFTEEREMWGGRHRDAGITRASDFWTRRNLIALSVAWEAIAQEPARLQGGLRFAFTASLLRASRLNRFGGNGVLSGTLYMPSLSREVNVPRLLRRKLDDFLLAEAELRDTLRDTVIVTTGSATSLGGVPDASVDYVFTDPPFGSNIFYADCSFLWEAWLGCFTDDRLEAVWNKSRRSEEGGKSLADYAALMQQSFAEMYRVLKPGRWASVVFHNSDDRVWNAIRDAVTGAGFELVNALVLDRAAIVQGSQGQKGRRARHQFRYRAQSQQGFPRWSNSWAATG